MRTVSYNLLFLQTGRHSAAGFEHFSLFIVSPFPRFPVSLFQCFSVSPSLRFNVSSFPRFNVSSFPRFSVSMSLRFSVSPFLRFSVSPFLRLSVSPFLCLSVSMSHRFPVSPFQCFSVSSFPRFNVSSFPRLSVSMPQGRPCRLTLPSSHLPHSQLPLGYARGPAPFSCLMSHVSCLLSQLSTSTRYGAEACAPILVTEIDAALLAKVMALTRSVPSAIATASAPLKQSPAAVVSMA